MDPARVPDRPQAQIIPSVHDLGEDRVVTLPVPVDPFNNPSRSNLPRISTRPDTSSSLSPSGNILMYSTSERSEVSDSSLPVRRLNNPNDHLVPLVQSPVPARLPESSPKREPRMTHDNRFSSAIQASNVTDWIVPTEEKFRRYKFGERLEPTLKLARIEREKCAAKARWTGYALNFAIVLQVLLGSLTTSLSAVAISGKTSTAGATTALGALATVVASYLAQARGSGEPDFSINRQKDLEHFIRDCEAFQMDHGHTDGDELDDALNRFRDRYEAILGNDSNGDQKQKPAAPVTSR